MTILHIVAGLPPGGGIAEAVPALCRHLRRLGHAVTIATLDGPLSAAAQLAEVEGVRIVRFTPAWPRSLYYSRAMRGGLAALVACADLVHVHSHWTFPVWWGCHVARQLGKPLVMSPRGCLAPVRLRRSAWKKRLAGIIDRYYLRRADLLHATCHAEAEGVAQYVGGGGLGCQGSGFRVQGSGGTVALARSRLVVIPNGVELMTGEGEIDRATLDQRWPECDGKQLALFLSRIDPIKGLDLLVAAWARMAPEFPAWHLLIAGPDEQGEEARIRQKVQDAGLAARVTFCGPLYGREKVGVLRQAQFLVLPTYHENFGLVVAEALASRVPVITTRGAPWAELESTKSGWWVEIGVEPLVGALRAAMCMNEAVLHAMGERGAKLVERSYQWPGVARQMADAYKQIITNTLR
jgi:glycosyltransferase involved in cell wall biosynthesis